MTGIIPKLLSIFVMALVFLSACKKERPDVAAVPLSIVSPPVIATSSTLVKDTAIKVSRDLYLWNTQIPATFKAGDYADPSEIMKAIRPFSIEPGFGSPVDKWSFAMKKTEWDQMSEGIGSLVSGKDEAGDFGMFVFFRAEGDLRVRLVEPNSPAGLAGIKRGWRITQINGNSDINTANSSTVVNSIYYSPSTSFKFTRPDGSSMSISLNAAHYAEKPVLVDTVYTKGSERIGYLVFNSFLGKTDEIKAEFQRVFSKFASQQVTNVVVDLRYNGGGYVTLAEKLTNYLAPASASGGVMMKQIYNSQNSNNNVTTYIAKTGNLQLQKVYFIVSKSTASSSELVINALKPYMDVRLVGPSATHGKPVGFFPVSAGDWYVFPVSFKTINKNGEGNYYNGLPVNASVPDGLDKDWGDVNESCLAAAIKNITTGGYFRGTPETYSPNPQIINSNEVLDKPFIKVTIGKDL